MTEQITENREQGTDNREKVTENREFEPSVQGTSINEQLSENSDLITKQRPNANYKLSKPDNIEIPNDELNFRYNRQRRLENAPQIVKDLYNEPKKMRISFFGVLLADKPRRMLFFVIIILCGIIMALSLLGYFDTSYFLEGNRIEISGTIFEGTTIILIKKTTANTVFYTGTVDIAVFPIIRESSDAGFSFDDLNEDTNLTPPVGSTDQNIHRQSQIYYHRIFFTMENEEIYRFAVPFDSPELGIVLQSEKNTLQLTFKPE